MRKVFDESDLRKLWRPQATSAKFSGGQVTIVGGSKLFHGAPLMALKAASRVVDMVYFSSFEDDREIVQKIKAGLGAFIWVDREELDHYVAKSDAVLVGPGLMRYGKEGNHNGIVCDDEGLLTRELTVNLFEKHPDKNWVVDGGSLQVIEAELLPKGAVITPNKNEFQMLFGEKMEYENEDILVEQVERLARKHNLTIAAKAVSGVVSDGTDTYIVRGGNVGLIKGGTGDVLAGLTVAFRAKNEGLLAVAAAIYVVKKASEDLYEKQELMYNADDLADQVPVTFGRLTKE